MSSSVADVTDDGLGTLDRTRAATMADEGGASAAVIEAAEPERRRAGTAQRLARGWLSGLAGATVAFFVIRAWRSRDVASRRRSFTTRGR